MGRPRKNIVENPEIKSASTTENKSIITNVEDFNIESLKNRLVVIKVGTESRPASDNEIQSIADKFDEVIKDNKIQCAFFLTHHASVFQIF
jgi:hypothetical protein